MTAQEFGELWSGHKVTFQIGRTRYGWIQGWREARVGTYVTDEAAVLVQSEEDDGRRRSDVAGIPIYRFTHFAGGINVLELLPDRIQLIHEIGSKKQPVKPRPHKCNRCQAPALMLATTVECTSHTCPNYSL